MTDGEQKVAQLVWSHTRATVAQTAENINAIVTDRCLSHCGICVLCIVT